LVSALLRAGLILYPVQADRGKARIAGRNDDAMPHASAAEQRGESGCERISTRLPACTATPAGDPCEVRIRASKSRYLGSGRLDGGPDRFDGYIAAGFGVGSGNDVAGPEPLREDGGVANSK
jgi:hypothetical protein